MEVHNCPLTNEEAIEQFRPLGAYDITRIVCTERDAVVLLEFNNWEAYARVQGHLNHIRAAGRSLKPGSEPPFVELGSRPELFIGQLPQGADYRAPPEVHDALVELAMPYGLTESKSPPHHPRDGQPPGECLSYMILTFATLQGAVEFKARIDGIPIFEAERPIKACFSTRKQQRRLERKLFVGQWPSWTTQADVWRTLQAAGVDCSRVTEVHMLEPKHAKQRRCCLLSMDSIGSCSDAIQALSGRVPAMQAPANGGHDLRRLTADFKETAKSRNHRHGGRRRAWQRPDDGSARFIASEAARGGEDGSELESVGYQSEGHRSVNPTEECRTPWSHLNVPTDDVAECSVAEADASPGDAVTYGVPVFFDDA